MHLLPAQRTFASVSANAVELTDAERAANATKHVVVGMSGGVDSSVTALLLKQQGYNVTGVYMKNWDASDELGKEACPHDAEFKDVQAVCAQLGIAAQHVNLVQSYWNAVFSPCLESFEEVRVVQLSSTRC